MHVTLCPMLWDVFCRVVDNYGDIGVCWRLSAQLAARGDTVRLWVDDPTPLEWMAPQGAAGVTVARWSSDAAWPEPGDAVIEAFGCELPELFVQRMAHQHAFGRPPVWINLEYLSAEPYVARSHRLVSPQLVGPGAGLRKQFFYPGFTADTGGLLRESDLVSRQSRFDAAAWRQAHGLHAKDSEGIVSLFCYDGAPLRDLIGALASQPTVLVATHGIASRMVTDMLGPTLRDGVLRALLMPALAQTEFDHLLWSCDINFVRGEDSFVRALWAGRPFVWHIYPQSDDAHARKLHAFNELYLRDAAPEFATHYAALSNRWNGLVHDAITMPAATPWLDHAAHWRERLLGQTDLVTQLRALAAVTG
ncbi:MAG: elongation factor P maturation arginine rhamnosyltransferase EarP [Burkholderiales bacterium]